MQPRAAHQTRCQICRGTANMQKHASPEMQEISCDVSCEKVTALWSTSLHPQPRWHLMAACQCAWCVQQTLGPTADCITLCSCSSERHHIVTALNLLPYSTHGVGPTCCPCIRANELSTVHPTQPTQHLQLPATLQSPALGGLSRIALKGEPIMAGATAARQAAHHKCPLARCQTPLAA